MLPIRSARFTRTFGLSMTYGCDGARINTNSGTSNHANGNVDDSSGLMSGAAARYMSSGNSENHFECFVEDVPRSYRVEHRTEGAETVVLARITNVFPHHDTLTQYVSRLLNERGAEPLHGELVLVDDETSAILARRDLGRACSDTRRGRPRRKSPDAG